VTLFGLERGYAKIQISENVFGYVEAKYIRSLGGQTDTDRRVAELEAQVDALRRQPLPIQSQPVPRTEQRSTPPELPRSPETESPTRFDVAGMFAWVRSFESGFNTDYFGWNAAVGGNLTKHFGLEANVSGNYWNSPVDFVGSSYHGFAGGPRFSFPAGPVTPYVHFLVGLTHGGAGAFGFGVSDNFLTLMPGFGLDVNLGRRFAIRAFQADYPVLRGGGAWSYKNMRIGGGFVTRF
jgi:hypothetical protein